jgi:hypothetical protein
MDHRIQKVYLLGCIMLAVFFGGTGSRAFADGKPFIEIPEPSYAFETCIEGTEINHTFVFTNKGDADLKILKVRTG